VADHRQEDTHMEIQRSRLSRGILWAALSALAFLAGSSTAFAQTQKWVATWATSMQGTLAPPLAGYGPAVDAYFPQPDLSFALPNSAASNQSFRMIVKPDLWGPTVRIRLSNAFGSQPVNFSAAAIALQDYQANIMPRTSTTVRFSGATSVLVQPGTSVLSDPVTLAFVNPANLSNVTGRNLAVSFAVAGSTGPITFHLGTYTTGYVSAPNSGNVTTALDDTAFPYTTTSSLFLNEVDVMAPTDTAVIVAFGDSIAEGSFTTINGNDRWLNVMSRKLHQQLGNKVSVVNAGIAGNMVVSSVATPSAVDRVNRDVIQLAGASHVIWMQASTTWASCRHRPARSRLATFK
jgi:hypothetical protein